MLILYNLHQIVQIVDDEEMGVLKFRISSNLAKNATVIVAQW